MVSPHDSPLKGKNRNPNYKKNLKPPWKPGQSGNPDGKPLGTISISAAIRKILDQETTVKENPLTGIVGERMKVSERVALSMIIKAIKGSERAAEILGERTEGKVAQPIRHSGIPAAPAIPTNVTAMLENMTDEQLEKIINRFDKRETSKNDD